MKEYWLTSSFGDMIDLSEREGEHGWISTVPQPKSIHVVEMSELTAWQNMAEILAKALDVTQHDNETFEAFKTFKTSREKSSND